MKFKVGDLIRHTSDQQQYLTLKIQPVYDEYNLPHYILLSLHDNTIVKYNIPWTEIHMELLSQAT